MLKWGFGELIRNAEFGMRNDMNLYHANCIILIQSFR